MECLKEFVMTFRIKELKEFLDHVGLNHTGNKKILRKRAVTFLHKFRNCEVVDDDIAEKITDLYQQTKMPLHLFKNSNSETSDVPSQRRNAKLSYPIDADTPFFKTLGVLKECVMTNHQLLIESDQASFEFSFQQHQTDLLLSGRLDPFIKYAVQLKFSYLQPSYHWEDIILFVKINGQPLQESLPLSHVVYITELCKLGHDLKNTIVFSSPKPSFLKNYKISVCIVERMNPAQVIAEYPLKEVRNTKYLVAKYLKTHGARSYKLLLICPFKKKIMQYPCRSILCAHADVFDLMAFLEEMQYFLNWKCPVCGVCITYESLVIEKTLMECLERGRAFLTYYMPRTAEMLLEASDSDIDCEAEIITIEDDKL